jgi:hypothetical protein
MKEHYLSEFEIDFASVKQHYLKRKEVSNKLVSLLKNEKKKEYVELAVGIENPLGNYSANEHGLGCEILNSNTTDSIYNLAISMLSKELKASDLPKLIYEARLPYLKIGVGSEMALLLQPSRFWVGNTRTIWSHLVVKHKGNCEIADEELKLYRDNDSTSEMDYKKWNEIYPLMEENLNKIYKIAEDLSIEQNVIPGSDKFLWIDAVCSALYGYYYE